MLLGKARNSIRACDRKIFLTAIKDTGIIAKKFAFNGVKGEKL